MEKAAFMLLVVLAAVTNYTLAQAPAIVSSKSGWHKIGEVKTGFISERESIVVHGRHELKSIKFRITDAPIDIQKVILFYASGETQAIPVRGMLLAGSETIAYTLENPNDELKKITFTYKSELNFKDEQAHVELYGLK